MLNKKTVHAEDISVFRWTRRMQSVHFEGGFQGVHLAGAMLKKFQHRTSILRVVHAEDNLAFHWTRRM